MAKSKKNSSSEKESREDESAESVKSPPAPVDAAKQEITIIGVGASAGGLDAFSQLLSSLPENPNLSIVFVQHLSPQYTSVLATLFSGTTKLPVTQLSEEITKVEINHVYVIPPNRHLILRDGHLELLPRPLDVTQYNPIDVFFQSLAEVQTPAIGVILSGTASDGVEGMHAIKAAGGTVIVQEPETSRFDGMPRAAISTGKVDLILPPDEIGPALVNLARDLPVRAARPRQAGENLALESDQLEKIFGLLRGFSGVDFSQYKLPTVQRRIQRRMAMHKVQTVPHYVKYLQENSNEVSSLYQDILIHVTRFFREPESFEILAKEVYPKLIESRSTDSPLRIWVPACSTGEEAYSVAISLMEFLEDKEHIPVQIFATDVSELAIEQARTGVYPPSIADDVSPERIRRFFTKTDGSLRINKSIRDLCVFARQDLTRDPPFSKLDMIVCRNVLIYLGQPIQKKLMGVFHYALKATGFLMLGSAETIGMHADLFAVADKKHRIYKKKFVETPDVHFSAPYTRSPTLRMPRTGEDLRVTGNVQGEANQLILDRFAPPGVIVNEDMQIVQFRGQTGLYLEPAPGDASLNLLKMCREGLLHGLRTAIQAAQSSDEPVFKEGLRVKSNGGYKDVDLEVIRLTSAHERHFLVLFHSRDTSEPVHASKPKEAPAKAAGGKKGREEVDRLQKELVASREYLQSIIQDLEAANEELQSANEEILSSNEELQSTNEELDTAKEELQSTNEELNTVNEELHGRNDELARINSDLVNLLNSVQIAIVIVANDLRIRRFTPMAERVLNLIPGDIGRPISQIKPNIDCPELEQLITEVIETISVQHRECRDSQGRWFSLTIRPYKNIDNRIDGAVLALFNLDDMRRQEAEAQAAREIADGVMDVVSQPLVVLDDQLRVKEANSAFCRLFDLKLAETVKKSLFELNGGIWNSTSIRSLLENEKMQQTTGKAQVKLTPPKQAERTFQLTVRKIRGNDNQRASTILAISTGD